MVWCEVVKYRGRDLLTTSTFQGLSSGQHAVQLRVIETTDLHLHLLPYDYYADRPWPGVGLISAARLIEEARAEVDNALLFDNGDFLQGTPMGDLLAQGPGSATNGAHPAIAAMNALNYDAITLGNHEFNYGLDFLMSALDDADFEVVSANLALSQGHSPRQDQTLVKPYHLLDRIVQDQNGNTHPIRIGVIGFAPPQLVDWDSHALDGRLAARDIVETAQAWVPEMREAGADLIIALAHTGIGSARHSDGMENSAIPLARTGGIDALLTGHSHLVFPSPVFNAFSDVDVASGTIAGTPAVMGGCWGAHIGIIDLLLIRESGEWQVLGSRSETRAVEDDSSATPSVSEERVSHAVQRAHSTTLENVRKTVGKASKPLHSYFSHLGVLDSLQIVAEAQRDYVARRLTDPDLKDLPILSAVSPFKSGGRNGPAGYTDIPAGELALRHIADLYAFPNSIAALCLTGAEILEWLERSASAFNRIRPGSTGTQLRNSDVPGYNFEVIDPLDVIFDLSQPARYAADGQLLNAKAQRVVSAKLDGTPLDVSASYILCTNTYRAGGAGSFSGAQSTNIVFADEQVTRDIVRHYVAEHGLETSKHRGSFAFTRMPATSVVFETGPEAIHHMDEIASFQPEARGLTRSGFLRLKLDLS